MGSTRDGTVRAGVSGTFRAFLARYPRVSAERLIAAAGIDPRALGDRDAVLDQQQWVALLESAAAEARDPCFGVALALQVPWEDLGVLAYVVLNSPTVGAALANSARYLAVQQTGGRLALDAGARVAHLTYTMEDPRILDYGQNAEGLFAMTVRVVREGTANPAWAPREVTFRHDGPDDVTRHERAFGCPVRFGRAANAIAIAPGDLALRFVRADAGLLPVLLRHAADCLAQMPRVSAFSDEVRGAAIAAIHAGALTVEEVARRLGVSPRSLQRRLHSEGSSFKAVVDQTRLALSERYLADRGMSLTETAFLLGYADLSAFSRAFRRWTGRSALEYRRSREQA